MIDRIPVRDAARGRWRGILPTLGLDAKALSGKHGPCPMCRGHDRFRFDDKDGRGTWICSNCGAGDGVALFMAKAGLDFREAAIQIEALVGVTPIEKARPVQSERSKRDAMNALWRSAVAVQPGDPVAVWLARRVGLVSVPKCLRSAPWVRYTANPVTHHPCMVAMVVDAKNRPATLHRTYLTRDGEKAPVDEPRRLMPGDLLPGCAVRLFDPAPSMGIAEGIETALAAASLFGVPVWAALTADNLAKWVPPEGVRDVTVFCDNDVKFAGQAFGWMLAHRLACREMRVKIEIPPVPGQDWNDVLGEQQAA